MKCPLSQIVHKTKSYSETSPASKRLIFVQKHHMYSLYCNEMSPVIKGPLAKNIPCPLSLHAHLTWNVMNDEMSHVTLYRPNCPMGCHRVLASDLLVHVGVTDVMRPAQSLTVKRTFIHPGWDLRGGGGGAAPAWPRGRRISKNFINLGCCCKFLQFFWLTHESEWLS